jgi:hypothetical protein
MGSDATGYVQNLDLQDDAPADNEYPEFSSYWDTNGSLIDSGTAYFNTTIVRTNATAFLEIDGTNYTASNTTSTAFNVSVSMSSGGTYAYYWGSWGNGTDNNYNTSVLRYYTVNASVDNNPNVTDLKEPTDPSTYSYGQGLQFNATVVDDESSIGDVYFEINGTNYTASVFSGDIYNVTLFGLPAGTHNYYWWADDSVGNINNTELGSFTLDKARTSGSLTGTTPIEYETAGDVEATESNKGDGDVTYYFLRQNVSVSNPDTDVLGVGTWHYVYNSSEGMNYTLNDSIKELTLTVNQNVSYILGISGTTPIEYGDTTDFQRLNS